MKGKIKRLAIRLLGPGLVVVSLLLTAESCYTPWQTAQTEKQAVEQFAVVKQSIYVPPDATLLAELYFSERSNDFAFAGVEQIYSSPRSCMEIVAEYRKKMTNAGWVVKHESSCDQELWLIMRISQDERTQFSIEAHPGSKARLMEKWQLLQKQHNGLYFVSASLAVWYEESSQGVRPTRIMLTPPATSATQTPGN